MAMRIAMAPNNVVVSSDRPRQSSKGIDSELEITVGDIQYVLIPNEEVVLLSLDPSAHVLPRSSHLLLVRSFPFLQDYYHANFSEFPP